MRQPPGMFLGKTALIAVLAGSMVLAASVYLGLYREAAFFVLGAAVCGLGLSRTGGLNRGTTVDTAGPETPGLRLLESVAEELKKALHTISGFSGMIAAWAAREGAEWRDSCDHLVEATRQLALFTSQLHDYARFERGALRLLEQHVDAAELVTAALVACEDRAERADAFIRADLSSSAELRCDAERIRQAITGLVQWVVETSPPGSVIDVCLVQSAARGIEVRLANSSGHPAADNGTDMFELQPPLKGLNSLALPIARRVALLHCGDVRVEAAQGAGTSASLSLPACRVDWPETTRTRPPRAA